MLGTLVVCIIQVKESVASDSEIHTFLRLPHLRFHANDLDTPIAILDLDFRLHSLEPVA